jgi:transglutaminase-like putative cysteine protease
MTAPGDTRDTGAEADAAPPSPRAVQPQFRLVAIPVAIALGAIGAIAAERLGLPAVIGFVGGGLAGVLTVLALPSVPTRRATVLLLGVGGLGALRHAPYPGEDRALLLGAWAVATLVALVLIDRADAEKTTMLPGGTPLAPRARELLRVSAILGAVVLVAAVALVPVVTDRLGRRTWPGLEPGGTDFVNAPSSLRAADELDMTTRPRLSDKVVFTVDSPRADFWRGETYDEWDGRAWRRSAASEPVIAERDIDNRVHVPAPTEDTGARIGEELRQTFHIETSYSDIVFAAPSPRYIETDRPVRYRPDGTALVSGSASNAFGKGSVYTVVSRRLPSTEADLRAAEHPVPDAVDAMYAQPLGDATTDRVRALAREITAGQSTTYDKVRAIERWLGANTEYSLDAPRSPTGVDVVDDFLFRSRLGWCEQIASSLVVLAREAGLPARLVTGFVPGDRDALTGRFIVREREAHAWAEIFFPGIGWQGFDPTASVPLAGEAKSGGSWLSNLREYAVPAALLVVFVILVLIAIPEVRALRRRRRAQRASWGARAQRDLDRVGRKSGRRRTPDETPREYAHALAVHLGTPDLEVVGAAVDEDAFSASGAPQEARAAADAVLTSLRP